MTALHPAPGKWSGRAQAPLAGALLPLSLAPLNLWPAGLVAIAWLFMLIPGRAPREAALRGWLFGIGLYGCGASWVYVSMHSYGALPWWIAGALTALFCMVLALVFLAPLCFLYSRFFGARRAGVLAFPALWALGEWSREWLFTGMPWLQAGYAQLKGPLAGWAPLVGVQGIGFLLAWSAMAAALWLRPRVPRRTRAWITGAALLGWAAAWPLADRHWTHPLPGKALSVGIVQANIPQDLKWQAQQLPLSLERYRQLSDPLWGSDILVWPETALPLPYHAPQARRFLAAMERQATRHGTSLLSGIPLYDSSTRRYYNGVVALGKGQGQYRKRRLVPFGEYIPLEPWVGRLLQIFALPMSSFGRGDPHQELLRLGDTAAAVSICYEIAYPRLVVAEASQAALLLTVSNDSWFNRSLGPAQHLQIAQMRALETGRYLVRGTNNGISAIIDTRGRIQARGPQFAATVVRGTVQAYGGATPLMRFGLTPLLLVCLLCLAGGWGVGGRV